MRALIDADFYLYRAASANEYEFESAKDVWTYLVRIDAAKADFTECIEEFERLTQRKAVICFGDSTNFRYALFPNYKSSRRKYRRPAGLKAFRDWVCENWETVILPNVEGDDVMALSAQENDVIVSPDKDMRTVPGLHLDGTEVVRVTQVEADRAFFKQALTGDLTDGYSGCKGMGPVSAEKALGVSTDPKELWDAVLKAYIKSGQTYDYAVRMARCARILRPGEYDHKRGEPSLWTPPE